MSAANGASNTMKASIAGGKAGTSANKNGSAGASAPANKGKGKGDKKTRSRAACLACKSTKQKCDGPIRIPCRRCELYGLECKFPGQTAPMTATAVSNDRAGPGETPAAVTHKLYEIANRLKSIESALQISHDSGSPGNNSRSPSRKSASPNSSDDEMQHDDEIHQTPSQPAIVDAENPIQEINASIDLIVGRAGNRADLSGHVDDYGAPDVIKRAVLTAGEVQELFDFFFCSIQPWVMMLSNGEDRDAMGVRERSSLLFHTVLLLSTSYSTPFPSQLHTTLVTYVNAIIAPQILSPQPHTLTTDFLRALDLLNLYKQTQFPIRRSEGKDLAESMRASKVNGLASWMMQGILARTADRLNLASVVGQFQRAYSASTTGADIPHAIIKDLRLYYWLLSNDVHGNVQSGRRCNMEGANALTTTRLFSSLQLQPYDCRLAASVEMFEVARPILRSFSYERTRRIARQDLERYNSGMEAWEIFWLPILLRQQTVDPLAMSVLCPFQWFITLQFNAAAYVSWKEKRFYASDSDSPGAANGADTKPEASSRTMRTEGARGLTEWEYKGLKRCVMAAEGLIFTLSEESRVPGAWRVVQWQEAEREDGYRKLVLDDTVVDLSKWGMDAITCVAYIFPLVFLCKLVNEGLLTANLELNQKPTAQTRWTHTQKLSRLLELGASFLDAVSLHENHPARSQAQVLRALLESGIKGQPPSPQLPRHAKTVLSPIVVSTNNQIFPGPSLTASQLQQQQQQNQQRQFQQWQSQQLSGPTALATAAGMGDMGGIVGLGNNLFAGTPAAGSALFSGMDTPGMGRKNSLGPNNGIDAALSQVLGQFDPAFGDNTGSYWEWGALEPNPDLDWNQMQPPLPPS